MASDGSPTYTVYDPLRRLYFKVNWATAAILDRMRRLGTLASLTREINQSTTIRFGEKQVEAICQAAETQGLTASSQTRTVSDLLAMDQARQVHPVKWLLHNYLYFRIPLLRPDAFLARTVDRARALVSTPAIVAYALISILGLGMFIQRMGEYFFTFSYFFTWQGLVAYGLTIAVVKTIHEFAHAYTAKAFGVRVPTMGVAFMVLWPVAFCDTTDAWAVPDRRKRLLIALSGVTAELVIAGIGLFGWGVSPPGLVRSLFFVVSSTSLAATLLVNINPAMSFDGYFVLMDLLGIDNLRPRAFGMTLWLIRKWLWGLESPPPEMGVSRQRMAIYVGYTIYAWLYRFFLYIAIAVLVYYKFAKALGVILFGVEVWWFILNPFIQEGTALFKLRNMLTLNKNTMATLGASAVLLLWFALPLPRSFTVPAVLNAEKSQMVYVPHDGIVQEMGVARGQTVAEGQNLLVIVSTELEARIKVLEHETNILKLQYDMLGLDERSKALMPQKARELESVKAQLAGYRKQAERNVIRSELGGKVLEWDETVVNGRPVSKDQVLGRIASSGERMVSAYVPEERVGDVMIGDRAAFVPDSDPTPISATVRQVSPVRTETIEHVGLTSLAKGELPVSPDRKGRYVLLESRYAVELDVADGIRLPVGQTGRLHLKTSPQSSLWQGLRHVYKVLVRESSF